MARRPARPTKRKERPAPISMAARATATPQPRPTPTDRLAESTAAHVAALDRERAQLIAEVARLQGVIAGLDGLRPGLARAEAELSHARSNSVLSSILNAVGGALMGAAGSVPSAPSRAGLFFGLAMVTCGVVLQVANRPAKAKTPEGQ